MTATIPNRMFRIPAPSRRYGQRNPMPCLKAEAAMGAPISGEEGSRTQEHQASLPSASPFRLSGEFIRARLPSRPIGGFMSRHGLVLSHLGRAACLKLAHARLVPGLKRVLVRPGDRLGCDRTEKKAVENPPTAGTSPILRRGRLPAPWADIGCAHDYSTR
jgi:hypothetical protein